MTSPEPDSVAINREVWTRSNERYTDAKATEAWTAPEITWGTWNIPESEVHALPDESFDLALSEYGASIWADPYRWIPEAARLLRVGGALVFLRNSTLAILCGPDDGHTEERLVRPQLGMHRFDWRSDNGGIEFHLAHGDWVRLLRANGFEILDLIELFAPADAVTHPFYDFVPAEWAKQWPSEELWVAQKVRA